MQVEALAVAEIAATERGHRCTLAVAVYSCRVLIGHGLARGSAEAVGWQAHVSIWNTRRNRSARVMGARDGPSSFSADVQDGRFRAIAPVAHRFADR
jgi:hypothetical protein